VTFDGVEDFGAGRAMRQVGFNVDRRRGRVRSCLPLADNREEIARF
jgi:hypothetical protein